MLIARAAAESTVTETSSATMMISTSSKSGGVELHDAAAVGLHDLSALDQQVDVPEHLAQREIRLRDRDVAPDRLRDLVRGARALFDQPGDLARAPLVHLEALVDHRHMLGELLAVAGQDAPDRHLARL